MEFVTRLAEHDDFDSIYPLFEQLWPGKAINKAELKKVFSRGVDSENDVFFCAVMGDQIIGFCAYAIVNNLWQEGQISYVYAMVIDEKLRGRGYGSALINSAISDSRNKGLKRVELDSGFQRERAHEFYLKFGFEKRAFLFSYSL